MENDFDYDRYLEDEYYYNLAQQEAFETEQYLNACDELESELATKEACLCVFSCGV